MNAVQVIGTIISILVFIAGSFWFFIKFFTRPLKDRIENQDNVIFELKKDNKELEVKIWKKLEEILTEIKLLRIDLSDFKLNVSDNYVKKIDCKETQDRYGN
jgi:peptidoglycan hydrolase CwlO-like protein